MSSSVGKDYHLRRISPNEWGLMRGTQDFAIAVYRHKVEAVKESTETVMRRRGSLTLYRLDGTVERKWEFP